MPVITSPSAPQLEMLEVPQLVFSWPACAECGSAGPFGVGKAIVLPAGPSHGVVPVVCRSCGDVRLFPADSFEAKT